MLIFFVSAHSTLLSMSGGGIQNNVDPALEDSGQVYAQRMGVCVDLDIPRHVVPLLEDADPDVRKEVRCLQVVVVGGGGGGWWWWWWWCIVVQEYRS
jgi:hypothetical protein